MALFRDTAATVAAPAQASAQAPAFAPAFAPAQAPAQAPAFAPAQAPAFTPAFAPAQAPAFTPTHLEATAPGGFDYAPWEVANEPTNLPTSGHLTPQELPITPSLPTVVTPVQARPVTTEGGSFRVTSNLGYGSFERIKLDQGQFWFGKQPMGATFIAHLMSFRDVLVYRDRVGNGKDVRLMWSYDGISTTEGVNVRAVLDQWTREGYTPDVKKQGEAVALVKSGPFEGQVGLCSLPVTAVRRITGYAHILHLTRGVEVEHVLTKVYAGIPIVDGSNTWTPWDFTYHGPLV